LYTDFQAVRKINSTKRWNKINGENKYFTTFSYNNDNKLLKTWRLVNVSGRLQLKQDLKNYKFKTKVSPFGKKN